MTRDIQNPHPKSDENGIVHYSDLVINKDHLKEEGDHVYKEMDLDIEEEYDKIDTVAPVTLVLYPVIWINDEPYINYDSHLTWEVEFNAQKQIQTKRLDHESHWVSDEKETITNNGIYSNSRGYIVGVLQEVKR